MPDGANVRLPSQFTLTHPNLIYRRGPLARRPQTRGCRNGVGRKLEDTIIPEQFHTTTHDKFPTDFQVLNTALLIFTHLTQNVRFSTAQDTMGVGHKGPCSPTISTERKKKTRIQRRNLEFKADYGQRVMVP